MADTLLFTDLPAGTLGGKYLHSIVWVSNLIGYLFYQRITGSSLSYRKTTDGGNSWGAATVIATGTLSTIFDISIWYDRWTPSDVGTKIHMAWSFRLSATNTSLQYRSLDTSGDVLSGVVTIETKTGSVSAIGVVSVTKARGGNLYVGGYVGNDGVGDFRFYKSTDGGVSFSVQTDPVLNHTLDQIVLMPGAETDTNDIWMINWRPFAGTLVFRIYDQSANTWTAAENIATGLSAAWGNPPKKLSAVQMHSNNHVFLAIFTLPSGSGDLRIFDIAGTGSFTERTSPATSVTLQDVFLEINQSMNAIYAAWLSSAASVGTISWSKSTNNGVTWSAVQVYNEDSADYREYILGCASVRAGDTGRFYLAFVKLDFVNPEGLYTNLSSVEEMLLLFYGIEILMDSSLSSDLKATLSGRILETLKRSGRSLSLATGVYSAGSTSANQQTVTVT